MDIKIIEKAIEDSDLGEDCQGNRVYLEVNSYMVDWLASEVNCLRKELATAEKAVAELMELSDKTTLSIDLLQSRLEDGAIIEFQNKDWCLFEENGEGICSGRTISKMLNDLLSVVR